MLSYRYVKPDYKSYEDFIENCRINVPEKFNFDFDVVGEMVRRNLEGEKKKYLLSTISKEKAVVLRAFLNLLG